MADGLPQDQGSSDPFPEIFQNKLQEVWGNHWNRYNRAVQSGNVELSESIHNQVQDEAARKASIAMRRLEAGTREPKPSDFVDMLVSNPRGWGNAPPPSGFTGSARSANTPMGDAVAQATGSPLAGSLATGAENVSRGVVDTAYGFTGIPMAQRGGENLAQAVSEGDVGKGAMAVGEIGLAAAPGPLTRAGGRAVEGIRQLAASAPKTAAGVTGAVGGGLALSPSEAAPGGSDEVRRLQEKLRDGGYYTGPIDGIMKGRTQDAKQRFQADEEVRLQREAERAKAEAEAAKAGADAKETERKRLEMEEGTRRRTEGEKRLRDMEEKVPPWRKALRDYAPVAGYGLGVLLGAVSRKGMNAFDNAKSAAAARRADDLMDGPRGDWPSRSSKVNQFWSEGGAKEVPFKPNPGGTPPFAANKSASGTENLYQPQREILGNTAKDAGMAGIYGTEAAIGRGYVLPQMQAEYDAAFAAVERDPSEANIERLQTAKDKLLLPEVMTNAGQAGALTHLATGMKWSRSPSRPNVSVAESERGRIDNYLASKAPPAESNYLAPAHARQPKPVGGHTWHKNPTGWSLQNDETKRFVSPGNHLDAAKKKR